MENYLTKTLSLLSLSALLLGLVEVEMEMNQINQLAMSDQTNQLEKQPQDLRMDMLAS